MAATRDLRIYLNVAGALSFTVCLGSGLHEARSHRAIDFTAFYAAGGEALSGHAAGICDPARNYAARQSLFGEHRSIPFSYPPPSLVMCAGLAVLP